MAVHLITLLSLLYACDCALAAISAHRAACPCSECLSRRTGARLWWPAAVLLASSALITLACGAHVAAALAALTGVTFAACGYLAGHRLPFAPLLRARPTCRPRDARIQRSAHAGPEHPPLARLALPSLGTVVELNQN